MREPARAPGASHPPNAPRPPAIVRATVFAGLNDNVDEASLYALDGTDGSVDWRTPATETLRFRNDTPTVAWPRVFLNGGSRLHVFDATNGDPLWSVAASTYDLDVTAVPAVADGVVYVPCPDGLCAYSISTHARLWAAGGAGQTPAVTGTRVFAACRSNASSFLGVCAYDASTGARIWQRGTKTSVSPPVVANGVVYVGTSAGFVRAFATDTGLPLAKIPVEPGTRIALPPIVVNGRLIVAGTRTLYSFGLP